MDELYEVETRVLNRAVKRNLRRFPADFMFQLDEPVKLLVVLEQGAREIMSRHLLHAFGDLS